MVRSISCGLSPRPTESEPCGSKSTSSTLRPYSASEAPRLIVVVVLPTPPFWLHIETTRAWPWVATRARLGDVGHRAAGGADATSVGRPTGVPDGHCGGRIESGLEGQWFAHAGLVSGGSGCGGEEREAVQRWHLGSAAGPEESGEIRE